MTASLSLTKPRKKFKNGTIAERTKGKYVTELQVTQYALEQLQARQAKLLKAHNGNDHEMRDIHIGLNRQALRLKELEKSMRTGGET